jgi:hypothetical protein
MARALVQVFLHQLSAEARRHNPHAQPVPPLVGGGKVSLGGVEAREVVFEDVDDPLLLFKRRHRNADLSEAAKHHSSNGSS